MEYGAIDLHTKECQIRIVAEDGQVLVDRRVTTARDRLTAVFGSRPPLRILIEASAESEWVAQHLERLGHAVVVADPNFAPMYGARTRRIKQIGGMWRRSWRPAGWGSITRRIGAPRHSASCRTT